MFHHSFVRLVITCASWLAVSAVANAATVTICWDPSAGPDVAGYVVYWGTQSGVYTTSLDVGNQTQQLITGLADGTTYYFVVRAYNSAAMLSAFTRKWALRANIFNLSLRTSGFFLPGGVFRTAALRSTEAL